MADSGTEPALPDRARQRIEKLESTVSELAGALSDVVSEMRRLGIDLETTKLRGPLLGALIRKRHRLLARAGAKEQAGREARGTGGATASRPSQGSVNALEAGSGMAAAVARGEAAKVEWVRTGEVVPALLLATAWGLTPQALGPAARRGELFAVTVKRQRYFPKEFLDLDRSAVATVCQALGGLAPEEKLVFWKRPHGALGGKTVSALLGRHNRGLQLERVVRLARARAAQAEADAAPDARARA